MPKFDTFRCDKVTRKKVKTAIIAIHKEYGCGMIMSFDFFESEVDRLVPTPCGYGRIDTKRFSYDGKRVTYLGYKMVIK